MVIAKGRIVERRRIEALARRRRSSRRTKARALAALDRALADSVLVHQRSDVPYGMFLSGGIDSSAVLAMMARLNERPVKAFTIGFSTRRRRGRARRPRAWSRARSAPSMSRSNSARPISGASCPRSPARWTIPTADYAILPTYKLAAAAREAGLKVILSGEGGDELFAGYGRYRSVMRPWWAGGREPRGRGNLDKLGVLRGDLAGWRDGIAAAELQAARPGRTRLQVAQATDCADWLPNDLLTKLDRCLMAHGVEGRTPFLDPVVADFAFRLPDELKVRKGIGKWLLRRWVARACAAAEPFARKRGFTVPVGEWIARRGAQLGPAGRGPARRARDLPARRGREAVPRSDAPAPGLRRLDACSSMPSGTAATSSACRRRPTSSPRWACTGLD